MRHDSAGIEAPVSYDVVPGYGVVVPGYGVSDPLGPQGCHRGGCQVSACTHLRLSAHPALNLFTDSCIYSLLLLTVRLSEMDPAAFCGL